MSFFGDPVFSTIVFPLVGVKPAKRWLGLPAMPGIQKKQGQFGPVFQFQGELNFRTYLFLFLMRRPARPIKPVPKSSIVAGSGTGAPPDVAVWLILPQFFI
jgi:hypothetical protein